MKKPTNVQSRLDPTTDALETGRPPRGPRTGGSCPAAWGAGRGQDPSESHERPNHCYKGGGDRHASPFQERKGGNRGIGGRERRKEGNRGNSPFQETGISFPSRILRRPGFIREVVAWGGDRGGRQRDSNKKAPKRSPFLRDSRSEGLLEEGATTWPASCVFGRGGLNFGPILRGLGGGGSPGPGCQALLDGVRGGRRAATGPVTDLIENPMFVFFSHPVKAKVD